MSEPSPKPAEPPIYAGIEPLAECYDAFLVDLWGVVHNGREVYPGVAEAMRRLRRDGKRLFLLSNAPRPSDIVLHEITRWGAREDMYDGLITSGDATIAALNERRDAFHAALGDRFHHIGPARNQPLIERIAGEETSLAKASYIVNTGLVDDETETLEDYREMLRGPAGDGMPMVCANPDLVVMRGEETVLCAGALADFYEQLGGPVARHGKPHASVFDAACARLGIAERRRIAMIGDTFHTDIAGGLNAGMDAIWVAGGIHMNEVGYHAGEELDEPRLRAFLSRKQPTPTAIIGRMI